MKVLIVEDNHDMAEIFVVMLRGGDYDCKVASSLKEGLRMLEDWAPRCLILDLYLEDSGGLETVKKVRKLYPGLGIVVSTGKSKDLGPASKEAGADEFIYKMETSPRGLVEAITFAVVSREAKRTVQGVNEALKDVSEALAHSDSITDSVTRRSKP